MTREEQAELIWKHNGTLKALLCVSGTVVAVGYLMVMYYAEKTAYSMSFFIWTTVLMIGFCGMLAIFSRVLFMAADTLQLMSEENEELKSR